MTSARYYQDELRYLRDMGREFAQYHPELAPLLMEPGADPSVERLLEGVAFLTGRIREKLDDELPEFTHALLEAFFPHFMRPVPSLTVMQFQPLPKAFTQVVPVERGAVIDAIPFDGTRCRFTTTAETLVIPLRLEDASLALDRPPKLRVRLALLQGANVRRVGVDRIRLYLAGDAEIAKQLLLCLCSYLRSARVEADIGGTRHGTDLPPGAVKAVGFAPEESILADHQTGYIGYTVLHEYFAFPEKFQFIEISGLDQVGLLEQTGRFELVFTFDRLPEGMPPVTSENLQLNCVPAVNLFEHDADPIRVEHEVVEYRLRPTGVDVRHHEIHQVLEVLGVRGRGKTNRAYQPLFHFAGITGEQQNFYALRQRQAISAAGTDHFISLIHAGEELEELDETTLSIRLRCTNRDLPVNLDLGEIAQPVSGIPNTVRIRNVTRPTSTVPAPVTKDLHWRLLSHLNANYASFASVEALQTLLTTYNFKAVTNRQERQAHVRLTESIRSVTTRSARRLQDGLMIPGVAITINVDETHFASTGDLFLFGSVLNELAAQFVSLNAFSQVTLRGARFEESFTWPARTGLRHVL